MTAGGSQRWTEPFQHLGWIFFVAGFLVLFLRTGREIGAPRLAGFAWMAGAVSMGLFLVALALNAASDALKTWFEAFETAGSVAMVVSVICAIWSVGGGGKTA
jgi:FtsH-binding integral membrane protein